MLQTENFLYYTYEPIFHWWLPNIQTQMLLMSNTSRRITVMDSWISHYPHSDLSYLGVGIKRNLTLNYIYHLWEIIKVNDFLFVIYLLYPVTNLRYRRVWVSQSHFYKFEWTNLTFSSWNGKRSVSKQHPYKTLNSLLEVWPLYYKKKNMRDLHYNVIDETFPVIWTFQEVVDLSLKCGPPSNLSMLFVSVAGSFAPFGGAFQKQRSGI